jgi:benzoylformate decarboxylase
MTRLAPAIRDVLSEHDVLFSAGGDLFSLSLPSSVEPVPEGLRIVHLDVDPWELGKNFPVDVAILGDPKATLPELTGLVRERMTSGARARAGERLEGAAARNRAEREALLTRAEADRARVPVQPLALLAAIGAMLPKDAVVVEEALSSGGGLRRLLRSDDPQSFFGLRGGGIGWSLPAAIGVKLALPERPVVALTGDGSAMYTCQALWTAAHDKVAVAFVILNNRSYRILKQRLHALRGHAAQSDTYVGMELTDPPIDFVALARSMGVPAKRARTVAESTDLLGQALASGGPMLIEVELDRAFKPL